MSGVVLQETMKEKTELKNPFAGEGCAPVQEELEAGVGRACWPVRTVLGC